MQSKYELTDLCIYTDPRLTTDVITLLHTTATPKISVLPLDGSLFVTLEFPATRAGFPLQRSQEIS